MQKTLGILLSAALVFSALSAGPAQETKKTVHFKKLQEFLPKIDLAGFTRGRPGGESSSAISMSSSEANVT